MVQQALSSLSEVNRETTILYYINGYSQKDISGFLGVPLGTVKRRLHDSRKLLERWTYLKVDKKGMYGKE